jgi:hypothetical protein
MIVTSNWGKDMNSFRISKIFFLENVKRPLVIECELCVYRQEEGESEKITRICFAHN